MDALERAHSPLQTRPEPHHPYVGLKVEFVYDRKGRGCHTAAKQLVNRHHAEVSRAAYLLTDEEGTDPL